MRLLAIYSFAVAALCFAFLGWIAFFAAPKIAVMHARLDPSLLYQSYRSFTMAPAAFNFTMAGVGISLAGLITAVMPAFWKRLGGKGPGFASIFLSIGSLIWLAWEGRALYIGSLNIVSDERQKMQSYRRVLDDLALTEAAEERIDKINERLRALNFRHRLIKEIISRDSTTDIEGRLNSLLRLTQPNQDPALAKRALATMPQFAFLLQDGTPNAKRLLDTARRITGQNFVKVAEFFEWVKQQETQGYQPIPMYLFQDSVPAK